MPELKKNISLREAIGDLSQLNKMGEIYYKNIYHNFRPYDKRMLPWIEDLKEGQSAFENTDSERIPHRIVDGIKILNKFDFENKDVFKIDFNRQFIQQFVEVLGVPGICEGVADLRVIMCDGKILDVYVRMAKTGKISNVSKGGEVIYLGKKLDISNVSVSYFLRNKNSFMKISNFLNLIKCLKIPKTNIEKNIIAYRDTNSKDSFSINFPYYLSPLHMLVVGVLIGDGNIRSEEHTSELQSH